MRHKTFGTMTSHSFLQRTGPAAVLLVFLFAGIFSGSRAAGQTGVPKFEDVPLPKSLTLCGEPMPLENIYVREMLDRELTISAWDPAQVFMWLKRAGRYFPHIEKRLREEGMPDDLKYLAVAESALITHIRSRRGALGTWQFMPHTARRNGLRKDGVMDERRNFEQSTDAALKYLKALREMFGSWTLAMAAYNCGESRLKKEIEKQKENNYYRLNLPLETERYIFRIASAKLIMQDPGAYGYALPADRVYKPIACDRVKVHVRSPAPIADVARSLGTYYKIIKELNPQIKGYYFPAGRYTVLVPAGLGGKLAAALKKHGKKGSRRAARADDGRYVVQPGDTLTHISQRTGVSVATLKDLNGLTSSVIRVGQKLRLRP